MLSSLQSQVPPAATATPHPTIGTASKSIGKRPPGRTRGNNQKAQKIPPAAVARIVASTNTAPAAVSLSLRLDGAVACGIGGGEPLGSGTQRPGARDATMATATLPPGSLQRMVRPRGHLCTSTR